MLSRSLLLVLLSSTAFSAVSIELVGRDHWESTPLNYEALEKAGNITREEPADSRIVMSFHHTVNCGSQWTENEANCVDDIKTFHVTVKGFADCAYHYMIGSSGKIYQGRPTCYMGSHTGGLNKGNVGIAFLGCFDDNASECQPHVSEVNNDMIHSAAKLVAYIAEQYQIVPSAETVVARSEYDTKKKGSTFFPYSPGTRVIAVLPQIIELASQYLAQNQEL